MKILVRVWAWRAKRINWKKCCVFGRFGSWKKCSCNEKKTFKFCEWTVTQEKLQRFKILIVKPSSASGSINKKNKFLSWVWVVVGVVQNVHLHNWSWSKQRQQQNLFVDRSLSNTEICDFDTPSCVHDIVIDQEGDTHSADKWLIYKWNHLK